MRRLILALVAAGALLLPITAGGAAGGITPKQLSDQGWTCFFVPGLGVHCAAPGQEWPPTGPTAQLLYFFDLSANTATWDQAGFYSGTETLLRNDKYHGQPCPTAASGEYNYLAGLGYWACHRQ